MKKKRRNRVIVISFVMAVVIPVAAFADVDKSEENTVTYDARNKVISGEYREPRREDYDFVGWSTKPDTRYSDQNNIIQFKDPENDFNVMNSYLNGLQNNSNTKLYAVWRNNKMKYAVSIYGINTDGDNTITFGPATGDNYIRESKLPHIEKSKETENDKCIHNHTWDEIIEQIGKNPKAFMNCVTHGCTTSVKLTPTSPLKSGSWSDGCSAYETGDGPSMLRDELESSYRYSYSQFNYTRSNEVGWRRSRIRAVLNGITDDTLDQDESIKKVTSEYCLFTWFPENLKKAIQPKKIDLDNSQGQDGSVQDKLWLFTKKYFESKDRKSLIGYRMFTTYGTYDTQGSWWLCSIDPSDSAKVYEIDSFGNIRSEYVNEKSYSWENGYGSNGIAPGFVVGALPE